MCVFTTLSSCSCAVHLFCGFCMWNGARELRLSPLHWLLTSPSKAAQWRFLSCYPTLRNPDAEKGKSRTKLTLSALSPFCKCCNLHFLLCQHEEETISEGQGVSVLCDQRVCIQSHKHSVTVLQEPLRIRFPWKTAQTFKANV